MAKRTRGTGRPGQRRPITRTPRPTGLPAGASKGASSGAATGLTADEEARAAELEARIVATEQPVPARPAPSRSADVAPPVSRRRASGGLAVQYAHEYDYVARDLKRILGTAGILTGLLVVIWLLIEVAGVGPF